VLANIVADILLLLIPAVAAYMKKDARLILSGVILDRADDIRTALLENGFEILRTPKENDWNAFLVKRA
jgi:ribosomal protein L11 methyltransferase